MLPNSRNRTRSLATNPLVVLLETIPWIIAIEIPLRVVAYFWYDHSKYYLFYGLHRFVRRVEICQKIATITTITMSLKIVTSG
jgi:hypothetical protein